MMISTQLYLIIICAVSGFQQEAEVIVSTLKYLRIGRCILSSTTTNKDLPRAMKKLMNNSIQTGFMEPESLKLYLSHSEPPDAKIAIAIKVEKSGNVRELFIENFQRLFWFTWVLISDDDPDDDIRIPFNCQFLVVKRGSDDNYQITEKYQLKNSSTFSNEFGMWTPQEGLNATQVSFYGRRMDMKGVELVRTDSENHIKCNEHKIEEEVRIIWSDLSKILNFSLRIVDESLEKITEDVIADGSSCIWGLVGLDFEKDWIFSNFGIYVRVVTKFRSANEIGWRAYARPFKTDMWTAIGIWLLLSTAAIIIVQGCTKKILYSNVFTTFFCLCNSDPLATHPANEPIPLSTKLVYLMAVTVPAVIVPAYSAYILSTLSIILPVEPFTDLKTLIADGSFRITTVSNTFIIRFMQGSDEPDLKYISDNLFVGIEETAPTFTDLFRQLCEDNTLAAFFVDTEAFRDLFPCKMFVMQPEVTSICSGFPLRKGSPIGKLFNEMFAQYREKGLLDRMAMQNEKPKLYIQGEAEKLSSLTMSQTSAIFLLIPLGVVSSLVVLAAETAIHKRETQNSWKNVAVRRLQV